MKTKRSAEHKCSCLLTGGPCWGSRKVLSNPALCFNVALSCAKKEVQGPKRPRIDGLGFRGLGFRV